MEHPVKGSITFPFDGTVELPDLPENGGSAPEETYHWFQDGKDLSIRVGDEKLNTALIQAQAWYRGGMFTGHIVLDKTEPQPLEPIIIFPRGNHIPFKNGGLARVGQAYGTGWYANKNGKDAQSAIVQWVEDPDPDVLAFGIQFKVPDSKRSGRLSRIKADYPTDWGGYGLFLSWTVGVP